MLFFFAHFIYCLPFYSWLSTFYRISYIIDLILNVFSFFFVCFSYLWAFISFCALAFVGFQFLSKDAFFMLSFFPSNFHGILDLAGGFVVMNSAATSMWAVNNFFIFVTWIMCFGYLMKSIEFTSYNYRIFSANISVGKRVPVVMCAFHRLVLK